MSGSLQGEVALVTGAGRGFGRAIAERLAAEGAAVALVARSKAQLDDAADEIRTAGGRALAVSADVVDPEAVRRAVAATREAFGDVTVLVNNAGVAAPYGPVGDVDAELWWRALAVHLRGPMLFMSEIIPGMAARGRGRIINVASLGAYQIDPYLSAYGVGKAAEVRLTEFVAAERRGQGIAAFAIEPGTVFTDLAESTIADPEAQRWLPGAVAFLKALGDSKPDPKPGLARCADLVARLASGRYDALSGRYIDAEDDLDEILREAEAGLPPRLPRRVEH